MNASVVHIYTARAWRLVDAERGHGFARRARIRARKALREPLVFDLMTLNDPRRVSPPTRTVPPSHKGRAA